MTAVPVTLIFADGATRTLTAAPGENVVAAADEAGLSLLTDCREGRCATCMGQLLSGEVELGDYEEGTLDAEDRARGKILTCVTMVRGACAIEFPYDSSEAIEPPPPMPGRVVSADIVAQEALRLEVELDGPLHFLPGQYVRLRPRGATFERSFSMANAPGAQRLVFFVRLVEGGRFSDWARAARPGEMLEVSHPHGSFFLRDEARPRVMVAGGTGLAPFLSMLELMAADPAAAAQPTTLMIGARTPAHLFALDSATALAGRLPGLSLKVLVDEAAGEGAYARGRATDALAGLDPAARLYLCGPPAMVDAGRKAALAAGFAHDDVLCERFT